MAAKWAVGDVITSDRDRDICRVIVRVFKTSDQDQAYDDDEDRPEFAYEWRYPHSEEIFDSRNSADNCEFRWSKIGTWNGSSIEGGL